MRFLSSILGVSEYNNTDNNGAGGLIFIKQRQKCWMWCVVNKHSMQKYQIRPPKIDPITVRSHKTEPEYLRSLVEDHKNLLKNQADWRAGQGDSKV